VENDARLNDADRVPGEAHVRGEHVVVPGSGIDLGVRGDEVPPVRVDARLDLVPRVSGNLDRAQVRELEHGVAFDRREHRVLPGSTRGEAGEGDERASAAVERTR